MFSPAQANHTLADFNIKASAFKYSNNYDSALFYYLVIDSTFSGQLSPSEYVENQINICEALVQTRNYILAKPKLLKIKIEIEEKNLSDLLVLADFLQVNGACLLGFNQDSSKYYLENAIELRKSSSGPDDTLLHYAWNKLGNYYILKGNFIKAIECHQKALELALKKRNPNNFLSATSYQNLGIAVRGIGDYYLAEKYFLKSLELNEILYDKSNPNLAFIYINLGKFYSDISKYQLALQYYDDAEKLLINIDAENLKIALAALYWNKGNIFTYQGDYEKAINYLNKALLIYQNASSSQVNNIYAIEMDIGLAMENKGDTIQAIHYYLESTRSPELPTIVRSYRNLGNIYALHENIDSATYYYRRAMAFTHQLYGSNSYDMALCYQYYGDALSKSKIDSSIWYYRKALTICESLFEKNNRDIAMIKLQIGDYYIRHGKPVDALNMINQALYAFISEDSDINSLKANKRTITREIYLPDALNKKADALFNLFKVNGNISYLDSALTTLEMDWYITEFIRTTYHDEESQMILNNNARVTVNLGIQISAILYEKTGSYKYLKEAYAYSEKGKSIILLGALRGLEAKSDASVPKYLIEKEEILNSEIANYNNFVYNEKQKKSPDDAKIAIWNDRLFILRQSYDSLLDNFQKNYPEYYGLKYSSTPVSANELQSRLQNDEVIVEYHLTDSTVYGFFISKDKFYLKDLGKIEPLMTKIKSLHQIITENTFIDLNEKDYSKFVTTSNQIYDQLILPFKNDLHGKRIIIVPDGELGFLTFDVLITDPPSDMSMNFKSLTWMIRENPISYSSSATIYFEQSGTRIDPKSANWLLACAPSYEYSSPTRGENSPDSLYFDLLPLTGTKEEVNSISSGYRSRKLFDSKASEANFKKFAPKYGILHLAMHTIIDNKKPLYSKLIFSRPETGSDDDGLLNTYELFNLKLHGELAVLSACNTGTGKLEKGEGIISLARGFFYAGIPSVVMTLWEIEDYSSAELMSFFYQNLKKGMPKDVALQQAKLSFLEKSDKLHAHPYYWAGFVNFGTTDPIPESTSGIKWEWALFTIFLGLLITSGIIFIIRRVYFPKKRL